MDLYSRALPSGSKELDALIARSFAQPDRNIKGDVGPRCLLCSGLGQVFRLRDGSIARGTTQCQCEGSGIDLAFVERMDRERLWRTIEALESKLGLPITSRYDLLAYKQPKNSSQNWAECIYWLAADGTAVANTTTETIVVPNVTVPASYMSRSRILEGRFEGKWSTTTGTVSHVYKLRWGGVAGTVLATTGTVTLLVSITNGLVVIDYRISTRADDTTGGVGSLFANMEARAYAGTAPTIGSATGAPALAPGTAGGQTGPAAVSSLTMNADTALSLTLTHGAASASNTATPQLYTMKSLN